MNRSTRYAALAACATLLTAGGPAPAATPQELTIILIRHGEKPRGGFGQLDCQGLNRALALPAVLARDFQKPDAIYAPNPAKPKSDDGHAYDYIRPLATIEPTAIALHMPVDVSYGLDDWPALATKLAAAPPGTIVVAWEHEVIVKLARAILAASGGDPNTVSKWDHKDFDGIDVLRIRRNPASATVEHRQEGLNGQSLDCPGPAAKK